MYMQSFYLVKKDFWHKGTFLGTIFLIVNNIFKRIQLNKHCTPPVIRIFLCISSTKINDISSTSIHTTIHGRTTFSRLEAVINI